MTSMASDEAEFHLIAVHGGAGYHSMEAERDLKKSLRTTCQKPLSELKTGSSAVDSVISAVEFLENDSQWNAGYGSNLTLDCSVECDASIMDGSSGDYGAVGAVSGVKNPIQAAHAVLQNSRRRDRLGRIPPLLLVGEGAHSFAREKDVECVPPESMICPRTQTEWEIWKARLDAAAPAEDYASFDTRELRNIQDTVGAVAWDSSGDLAAGVSSGGLLLKHPGRVGEAAIFGAGCWASQTVACSVSGCGEYIARASLAKTIAEAVAAALDEDTHSVLQHILEDFQDLCRTRGETDPSAGILLVAKEQDKFGSSTPRLWCAFTTQSMAVAYASSLESKPQARILRRPSGTASGFYITALPMTR